MTASSIFKANDIRGIYNDTLHDDTAYRIGAALGRMAATRGMPGVAVGRDGRLSSPALADALIDGLCAAGMPALDVGLVPTPALYYAAVTRCGGSGVMVTGSHNPKNYNGFKMMLGGGVIMGDAMQRLRADATADAAPPLAAAPAACQRINVKDEYITAVAAANPLARPLNIVLDAGNGAAGEFAPALFAALGCRVTPLFCEIDGNFPNHHPDPAQPENLQDAARAAAQTGADLALAFDGDGDRLGALPAGRPAIFADRLLMLFARDLLSRQSGARVVFDVKCSANLAPWVEQHGGIADMQPTGHAFIKARMAQTGAALGGEMSGHFYFMENWHGFDDALFAGARLAATLAENPAVFDDIPDSLSSPELHIDMTGKDQHQFVATLAQNAAAAFADAKQIVSIDGLRVEYDNGFGLVRASNTTPALVLRFEAADETALQNIKSAFATFLHTADPALILPF